jgi:hypothetical protein
MVLYRAAIDPWLPIYFLKIPPFLIHGSVIPSAVWGPVLRPLHSHRIRGKTGPQATLGITLYFTTKASLAQLIDLCLKRGELGL